MPAQIKPGSISNETSDRRHQHPHEEIEFPRRGKRPCSHEQGQGRNWHPELLDKDGCKYQRQSMSYHKLARFGHESCLEEKCDADGSHNGVQTEVRVINAIA